MPRLPAAFEGFTILHLTDLHGKRYGAGQRQLLDLLGPRRFDMVAVTGDVVTGGDVRVEPLRELLEGVNGKPVFYVNGNHEWYTHAPEKIERAVRAAGGMPLRNGRERMQHRGEHLWVVGVDDPLTGHARLEEALAGVGDEAPRILLAHAPTIYPLASERQIDLLLVGHTHGGQFRLPVLGAPYVSRLGYFPRWSYGYYRDGESAMVVNAGLGETYVPLRVNIRPEAVLVTLVAEGGDTPVRDQVAALVGPVKKRVREVLRGGSRL